jgi:hypothetical protein
MIDNQRQVERLIAQLEASLPLYAAPTSDLAGYIKNQCPQFERSQRCRITEIHYAGDPGGIMCRFDLDSADFEHEFVVSITHLTFPRRHPLARAITAYQKHRLKRIRVADTLSGGSPRVVALTFS